jgi:hypothetical protein
LVPFDIIIIANAVVTHPNSPLADPYTGQVAALMGIFLKRLQCLKHALMYVGVKPAKVATEAVRDDKTVARHVTGVSFLDAPWFGGPGEDPLT